MSELIDDAVMQLYARLETGSECPCCGQMVKSYKRRLRANHVKFLLDLIEKSTRDEPWVHYRKCRFAGRDYNYLAHFGLAEFKDRGLWQPTTKGRIFALGQTEVPEWVEVYNNRVIGVAEKTVHIHDCLNAGDFNLVDVLGDT
jgi:hypothetical protein